MKHNRHSASSALRRRARKIRIVLMDVDGVLTDGKIFVCAEQGGKVADIKLFHAHDGVGLKLAKQMGLFTGVISGRHSPATAKRAIELGIDFVFQGQESKLLAYQQVLKQTGATDEEVCYIGDDLPDLPLLRRVGLAVSVPNAAVEAKKNAHYITDRPGGDGAVREVIELIFKAKGQWREAVATFMIHAG
ncbi:MAG: HAD hydrolase family protein [Verrucomicrobiota bacterium]|nr:HAD hydrolase family protein [Verrucomicrobiota bacterium]